MFSKIINFLVNQQYYKSFLFLMDFSPRIENPIEGSTSINDQYIQAIRRLKKRYRDLFVIGEDELKPMKGKPGWFFSKNIIVNMFSTVFIVDYNQ